MLNPWALGSGRLARRRRRRRRRLEIFVDILAMELCLQVFLGNFM